MSEAKGLRGKQAQGADDVFGTRNALLSLKEVGGVGRGGGRALFCK